MNTRSKKDLDDKFGKMTIAKFIRAYRKTEALSQAELANFLGWPKSNICDIETGRRNLGLNRAVHLSKRMGFPVAYVLETIFNQQLENAGLDYEVKLLGKKEKIAA